MKRVIPVTAVVLCAALVLTARGNSSWAASTPQGFNWKQHSGQTINVMMAKNPQSNFVVKELPVFKELTGITVNVEQYPEGVYHAKLAVAAASRSSQYDGWAIEPPVDLYTESKAGWIRPIDGYLKNDVAPDFDYDGIFKSARAGSTLDGHVWGLPYVMAVQLFYYRKDIFQKLGLEPPATLEQWLALAKTLKQELPAHGYKGVWPLALRANAAEGNVVLAGFFASEGGQWFKNGKFDLTSPASIKSVTFFKELMKYAPPGEPNFGWEQVVPLFAAGKLAMFSDDAAFNSVITGPKSTVAGKIGYAEVPAGPAGAKPWLVSWNLVINNYSKHPAAMWLFMQWVASPKQAVAYQREGGTSWRVAAWQDAEAKAYAAAHDLTDFDLAFAKSLPDGNPHWVPPIAEALRFRKVYGTALVNVLEGMDPMQAMKQAETEANALLAEGK